MLKKTKDKRVQIYCFVANKKMKKSQEGKLFFKHSRQKATIWYRHYRVSLATLNIRLFEQNCGNSDLAR